VARRSGGFCSCFNFELTFYIRGHLKGDPDVRQSKRTCMAPLEQIQSGGSPNWDQRSYSEDCFDGRRHGAVKLMAEGETFLAFHLLFEEAHLELFVRHRVRGLVADNESC
jgi:hypothetical protein